MKWIIFAVLAIAAVMHWGFFGLMCSGVVMAAMLENEPNSRQ